MATPSGGSEKAFFTNVDASETFYVQFNPKQLTLSDSAKWETSKEIQNDRPKLTFTQGDPSTLGLELIFDTTDTMEDCHDKYVKKLRSFLANTHSDESDGLDAKRPPHLLFTWNDFVFECVLTSITTTYLMFRSDGTPLRAKVDLKLQEREREEKVSSANDRITLSAMGSMFAGSGNQASTYTVRDGDTLSSVAAESGASMRDIAIANAIDDPMNLIPGQKLVIPGDPGLAEVLGAKALADANDRWADDSSPIGDFAGALGAAPSALGDAFDGVPEIAGPGRT